MINAVGRDIPDYLLADGKEVYQGRFAKDGQLVKRDSPTCVMHEKPVADKLCATAEVLGIWRRLELYRLAWAPARAFR